MKSAFLIFACFASQASFAQIKKSNYEIRHQSTIEDSILEKCGTVHSLTQYSQTESMVRIDNGIADVQYTTTIYGYLMFDRYVSNEYRIVVESVKSDMYDHVAARWGTYYVSTVSCTLN